MTDEQFVELMIPAESSFVATARRFITDVAGKADWMDQQHLDDLRLMASEAVTNALRAQRLVWRSATRSASGACCFPIASSSASPTALVGSNARPTSTSTPTRNFLARAGSGCR